MSFTSEDHIATDYFNSHNGCEIPRRLLHKILPSERTLLKARRGLLSPTTPSDGVPALRESHTLHCLHLLYPPPPPSARLSSCMLTFDSSVSSCHEPFLHQCVVDTVVSRNHGSLRRELKHCATVRYSSREQKNAQPVALRAFGPPPPAEFLRRISREAG